MHLGIFKMQSQKCHIEVQIFEVVASISNVLAYQGRYWYLLELFYPSPDPSWQETINNQQGKSLPTLIKFFFFKEKRIISIFGILPDLVSAALQQILESLID